MAPVGAVDEKYGGTCSECSLGISYWLLLVAALLSLGCTIIMFIMRVGFEQWEFLDQDGKVVQAKPDRVQAEQRVTRLDEDGNVIEANDDDGYYNQDPNYYQEAEGAANADEGEYYY
eukprot:NODE_7821_length_445_cov_2.128788_g7366_i0.p1 GENE.NODE_7821_length_445_cov_2.128788_g7366_i0~~NODE_7821_length_445_cov_2.128788_g7366_i0.p1  ORF type:complete len:131 (-),score=43.01 NODE_7821_length_445_cov_2.128788_g7366_i0:52-402(-)